MKGLPLLLGLVAGASDLSAQGEVLRAVAEAREEGRYGEAWRLLEVVEDPVQRAKGEAELLAASGDLGGALSAAERGLEQAPGEIELAWRAASISITLGDAARSVRHVGNLEAGLATAELAPEHRAAWASSLRGLSVRADELGVLADKKCSAIRRARWIALLLIALSMGSLAALHVAVGRR